MQSLTVPIESLIDRVSNGAFLRDLAHETGVDKRRLSEQLRKHPDYPSARESAIECQLDSAQEAIEGANEATDIARARERFRAASWRAEREAPERWGNKAAAVTINILQLDGQLDGLARDAISQVRALPAK